MKKLQKVNPNGTAFDISRDLSISARSAPPGPPQRVDGMTVGIVQLSQDAPHNGELHPDGDELLYLISGRILVRGESAPESPLELEAGDACIVRKGEWHKVELLEESKLVHITPGPNGSHRPLTGAPDVTNDT